MLISYSIRRMGAGVGAAGPQRNLPQVVAVLSKWVMRDARRLAHCMLPAHVSHDHGWVPLATVIGSQVPELLLTLRRTKGSLIEKNMSILLSTTLSMKLA